MAIFEEEANKKKSYVALLDATGENLVAFITPVKGISKELMVKTLISKGLKAEVRETADDVLELAL